MSSLINGGRMERIINAIDEKIIWKKECEKVKRKKKIHFLGDVEWFMIESIIQNFPLMATKKG